jgi:aromatic ring-opening dioxygenase catalytic subunit (LigB family)
LLAHAPTIMLPKEVRYELNEGKEISLVPGLHRFKAEVMDVLKPDAVILFDSHWFTTVEFCVTAHERRSGLFTSDELPRGMSQVPYDLKGNPALARSIAEHATACGVRTTAIDDPFLPIHYPTVNIAHHLHADEEWITVGCAQTGETPDFLRVGEGVGKAIAESGHRVLLIASGSMSHRFWPLSQLHLHEASDPIHISRPEAREADYERLEWFAQGNHAAVIETMPEFLKHVPEARFGHYLMMAGACGGRDWTWPGVRYSDYENATGTSQVHVYFARP